MIPRQAPIRAAIYARSATVAQDDDGDRLQEQAAACRRLAGRLGADIIAEHRDVGSGTSWDLPGLQALLDLARRHGVDVVLCERRDRLARGVAKLCAIEEELERVGVAVRYALDDPSSATVRHALASALACPDAPGATARKVREG
jgi:DNA invertase Pin-like site-specific DNA recombinase